jgi:pimeloyl-ACP methyl ester carboxylesterase
MEQIRPLAETQFNCFHTAGAGPLLIFVHCSSANHKQWRFLIEEFRGRFEVLAPDLLGYGGNAPWPAAENPYSVGDLELIESLLPSDRPYHIIAHSYGAALALEVARRSFVSAHNPPQSLFLIEPVTASLVRDRHMRSWRDFMNVSEACIRAVERRQLRRAAAIYMGYWIGRLRWLVAPRKYKNRIIATMHKVAYEFKTLLRLAGETAEHHAISCPLTLVVGDRSPHSMRAVAESLFSQIPNGRQEWIHGAGHMSPFTHPQRVKELVKAHMDWVTNQTQAGTSNADMPPQAIAASDSTSSSASVARKNEPASP